MTPLPLFMNSIVSPLLFPMIIIPFVLCWFIPFPWPTSKVWWVTNHCHTPSCLCSFMFHLCIITNEGRWQITRCLTSLHSLLAPIPCLLNSTSFYTTFPLCSTGYFWRSYMAQYNTTTHNRFTMIIAVSFIGINVIMFAGIVTRISAMRISATRISVTRILLQEFLQ